MRVLLDKQQPIGRPLQSGLGRVVDADTMKPMEGVSCVGTDFGYAEGKVYHDATLVSEQPNPYHEVRIYSNQRTGTLDTFETGPSHITTEITAQVVGYHLNGHLYHESEWMPPSEALPNRYDTVLVANADGHVFIYHFLEADPEQPHRWLRMSAVTNVVAWMSLPEHPTAKNRRNQLL